MKLLIFDRETGNECTDQENFMELAGLDTAMGFEDIGIQRDGTPVVFDKCGNFGYLDPSMFRVTFDLL